MRGDAKPGGPALALTRKGEEGELLRLLPSAPAIPLHPRMDVRDARPEDAEQACRVTRRSILELCEADHLRDPVLLAAWR